MQYSYLQRSRLFHLNSQLVHKGLAQNIWSFEPDDKSILTEEEQKCETFFTQTTKRTEEGRYIVKLPFRDEEPLCKYGNSRNIAVNRLKSLEKRLAKDNTLKEQYKEVINEYLRLDHMIPVEDNDKRKEEAVYLPHHAVVRNDKETTKVRVVYNASSPNNKGVSLNDTLMVGPTLQADLRHIILRWRTHNIAIVADIVKMYRQVRIADEDAVFQRIVWRDNPEEDIKDYELKTVTFGTSPAPYLAVRALQQLAYDEGKELPLAAENVLNRFYIDDLMSGCSQVEEGVNLYKQMVKLLGKGGFQLQKWNSNNQELLEQIRKYENKNESENIQNKIVHEKEFKLDTTIKILGLTWNRSEDNFRYSVQLPTTTSGPVTKRMIISDIAKLFDPLGWIAPTVIIAKMIIQKLWLTGRGWDEAVPDELLNEWETYRRELPQLTAVRIPRWLGVQLNDAKVELHGFCDASKLAYAAVIYLRVIRPSTDRNRPSSPRPYEYYDESAPRSLIATDGNSPSSPMPCEYCTENHKLTFCKKFADQETEVRRQFVAKNRMCFNCLGGNHNVYQCRKPTTCRICRRRHNTLLHISYDVNAKKSDVPNVAVEGTSAAAGPVVSNLAIGPSVVSNLATGQTPIDRQVLLATALIKAEARSGECQTVRALLDQGSQACFITEATAQLLRLTRIPVNGRISGLGNEQTNVKASHMVITTIRSRTDPKFTMQIRAYVLKNITSYLPERKIKSLNWLELENLELADPQYNSPHRIDMLLGADVYSCILNEGVKKSPSGTMIAQNTSLGWILSGVVNPNLSEKCTSSVTFAFHAQCNEDEVLKRFWEIEEQPANKSILTEEEQKCETFFTQTTKRTEEGRYIVKLPFRDEEPLCKYGNSRNIAVNRLKSLEKRLAKDNTLKEQYKEVINEYLRLDHMIPVEDNDKRKEEAVYLPHHAVVRNDKETTKVRVVYNASSPNNKGVSLNDTLMVGPTLQADLRHIILRWRTHNIAIVADIVKMYRQVRIADEDAVFQRIVWRDNPEEDIKDYELKTVTFGTSPAPYLAVRALQQLAYDEGKELPLAAENVLNRFYIDDLMSGCSQVEEGVNLYKQMVKLLGKGGFQLQKWNSNNQELLEQIRKYENKNESENIQNKIVHEKEFKLDTTIKILGLTWNRSEDNFRYSVQLPTTTSGPVTKRMIISDIAKLFDPLGWIAPTVIIAKMIIQKLWLTGRGWDEAVPDELLNEWETYRRELPQLTAVRIPRWLGVQLNDAKVELHGFCDASKLAYAAVIYLRVIRPSGEVHTSLLVAKTRVAPIKQISIPKPELCGAVLLTKLIQEAMEILSIGKEKVKAWTDSTIVLAWLNSHPSRWKTFVANRVSEILSTLDSSQWYHVVSERNPADCASRGVPPSMLAENNMWLYGPQFLREQTVEYKRPRDLNVKLEENVKVNIATVTASEILERFSSLQKMLRIIAYCRRFITKKKGYIQKIELDEAWECCVKRNQAEEFAEEMKELKAKGQITSKNSVIKSLSPYIDEKGILRVGGRLQNSSLPKETMHPIILRHSHLAKLIVDSAHKTTLHGGSQLMLNHLRSTYWIIGAKSLVRQHIRSCVKCVRERATVRTQFMGSLPAVRCTPARAFKHSGVDYAGPIQIRTTKGRGNKSYKGYICLFICMATRAIHLELVSDMSTQAFLAAFKRFVSRRGHCSDIWSDNGTTFVGASKELQELTEIQRAAAEHCESNGTKWHFIPPRAPNFGGLWEAAVKSTKYHLKRVIGESMLTFEEMSTLLTQVEACLNSRPITTIDSTDQTEPLPLTPGHFLIGESLIAVSDHNFESSNINSLTRWQHIQRSLQCFWRRWSNDYLTTMLHRYKWTSRVPEPNVDDVVLIKEDDMPPGRWLLGRVMQKHPGPDNVTRVVTLRTSKNVIKRPTSKLCILPVNV